jgi:hypothetical protein
MSIMPAGYDDWLERPIQEMYETSDAYVEFCETHDLDPDEDNWTAFHEYEEGLREDGEERRAEARAEREVDYGD